MDSDEREEELDENSSEKLEELIKRASSLMDQVNSLYNLFIQGVEKLAPLEKQKQLEDIIFAIQAIAKPTQSYQFKAKNIQARYLVHRDRWNRLLKDLEAGKIKRKLRS